MVGIWSSGQRQGLPEKAPFLPPFPGFTDEGHPREGLELRADSHLRPAPLQPGHARRCPGNNPPEQVAPGESPRGARPRPTPASGPDPPLSARGTWRYPKPRPLGGEPGKLTNQRDGHIAQAANPRGRVIPRPPGSSAAGAEAATAGVAVEAAAGAGRVALLRGAGPGWPLLAPGREGGLPGGRDGPRLGRWEKRRSPGCWGGGAAAPHSSQVRRTPRSPRPATRPPPPTWLPPAPAGHPSAPRRLCRDVSRVAPGQWSRPTPPTPNPQARRPTPWPGRPCTHPLPLGQGFRVSASGSPAGPPPGWASRFSPSFSPG